MIGLGRMGANIVRRLHAAGHECVVYDVNPDSIASLVEEGVAVGAESEADLASKLSGHRAVWVMVPAAYAGDVVMSMSEHLEADDIIIDGGNTHYPEDIKRADALGPRGIHYVDIGTSGGVFGLDRGYCLMIGGDYPRGRASRADLQRLSPRESMRLSAPGAETASPISPSSATSTVVRSVPVTS